MPELTHAPPELIPADTCASLAGCKVATWRGMVSEKLAPPPRGWRWQDGLRGWDPAEVLRWLAARPGSGNHARGRARRSPQTRTRSYSLGTEPAHRERPPARVRRPRAEPVDAVPIEAMRAAG